MPKHVIECIWFGRGRRSSPSCKLSAKTTRVHWAVPVVPRPFVQACLTKKLSYYFRSNCGKVREKRTLMPTVGIRAGVSVQRCCCSHVVNLYLDVADALHTRLPCPYSTPTTSEKLVLGIARDTSQTYFRSSPFPAAAACCRSSRPAAKQGSGCRPQPGEVGGRHFFNSALNRHSNESQNESQGYYCRHRGDVRMYVALVGRRESGGRQPNDLLRQHHPAIGCGGSCRNSRGSPTEGTLKVSGEVRPSSIFNTTPYNSSVAGPDVQGLPLAGISQWKNVPLENEKGVLKQLPHLSLLSIPGHSFSSSDGGPRAPQFLSAARRRIASEQRQSWKSAFSSRFGQVPAIGHAAGRRELMVTRQQCCLMWQMPEYAADLSVRLPFLQAPAGTIESQWTAIGTCPFIHAVWCNLTYGKRNSEGCGFEEQQEKQKDFWCQGDNGLRNCGEGSGLKKTWWERQREVSSVLHGLFAFLGPSTANLHQSVTLRSLTEAAKMAVAAARRTLPPLPSTALRASRQTDSPALARESQSPHRDAWAEATLEGGSAVAPTRILSCAEISQACAAAITIITGATTERAPASGIEGSPTALKIAGVAGSAAASSTTVDETSEGGSVLLRGVAADVRWARILHGRAFIAPTILVARLNPAGLFRRQAVTPSFHVAEKQQQHLHCHFAGVLPLSSRWMLPAFYASSSAAAVDTPGMKTRSTRAPTQLSKKELKGLQGHPRRYQLMGGRPEFHHIDRNKNGHIIEPTDKFQVVMTTSKNNVHAQVLNKSRAYRTIFGSFAGNVGYRKRAQQEPRCAYRIGQNIARKCRRLGICQVDVKFRRIMRVEQLLQAFAAHGLGVTSITHEPRLPKCGQNSTKPRKRRRV